MTRSFGLPKVPILGAKPCRMTAIATGERADWTSCTAPMSVPLRIRPVVSQRARTSGTTGARGFHPLLAAAVWVCVQFDEAGQSGTGTARASKHGNPISWTIILNGPLELPQPL